MNNPVNRRWGDLLIAEHIALYVLGNYGFITSESQIIESQNRVFLEYNRIDRVGRYGRRGTSSLSGIDAAFIGLGSGSWASTMKKANRYFSQEDIHLAERIYNFGLAIGNTDMHFGNISFFVKRICLSSLRLSMICFRCIMRLRTTAHYKMKPLQAFRRRENPAQWLRNSGKWQLKTLP